MKNRKFPKWIIFIIIIIVVIIAALFLVKNQKSNKQSASSTEDVIVKDNVYVIDENNAPDQITDNSLVYDEKPEYEEGDVLVAGIIDGAEDGFIRRVTNVEKKDGDYIVETEPALLTDVFEKASIIKRFVLTDDGMEEVGFQSETTADGGIINNAMIQTSGSYSAIQLSNTKKEKSADTANNSEESESEDEDDDDDEKDYWLGKSEEIEDDPLTISYDAGLDAWLELDIEIKDDDIKCGLSIETKAEADVTADFGKSLEKEFETAILSKRLPNYQIMAGIVPIVVTNKVEITVGAEANLEGNVEISYNPSIESSLGVLYDSKKGKIEPIKKCEKNIDALQWDTQAGISGDGEAKIDVHYITKLYGKAGIDISAGVYGSVEGAAKLAANGNKEMELSGNLDLEIGPELEGNLVIDIPVFTKDNIEKKIFDSSLPKFWSRHWEVGGTIESESDKNTGDTSQETSTSQSDTGNLGTTYKTRFADVNQIEQASVFQFDIPSGWKVESEEVGALTDYIQEKIVISNNRGVTVTYWDIPQEEIGGHSGVSMVQANVTKAADSDFVTTVRDPESAADLADVDKFMVARVHIIGELYMPTDSEFTPIDGATFFALVPTSYLGDREFVGQAGNVDEFSFYHYGWYAFIAEAPDGQFTAKEEQEVIQILQSFKEVYD